MKSIRSDGKLSNSLKVKPSSKYFSPTMELIRISFGFPFLIQGHPWFWKPRDFSSRGESLCGWTVSVSQILCTKLAQRQTIITKWSPMSIEDEVNQSFFPILKEKGLDCCTEKHGKEFPKC